MSIKALKNQRGSGAIFAVVAGVVLMCLFLASSGIVRSVALSSQYMKQANDQEILRAEVVAAMGNPDSCRVTLYPVWPDDTWRPIAIKNADGSSNIVAGMQRSSIKIVNIDAKIPSPAGPIGVSKGQLRIETVSKATGNGKFHYFDFEVWVGGRAQRVEDSGIYSKQVFRCSYPGEPKEGHLAFVTLGLQYGDFGGLAAADTICQNEADGVAPLWAVPTYTKPALGGTWKALLSDNTTSARSRFKIVGPVFNMKGEVVAENGTDLWDGKPKGMIQYNSNFWVNNNPYVPGNSFRWKGGGYAFIAWTGSMVDGRSYPGASCVNWTDKSPDPPNNTVLAGPDYGDKRWFDATGAVDMCENAFQLYCMSFMGAGTPEPASMKVLSVNAGNDHTCAVLTDNSLRCWGRGEWGQIGNSAACSSANPLAVSLGSGRTARAAALGGYNGGNSEHTCVLLDDNTVKCFGTGIYGQLGTGTDEILLTPTLVNFSGGSAKAIAAGSHHTCAIKQNDALECWGDNSVSQLGIGSQGGESLTPVSVNLGPGKKAKAVALGHGHSCAILDDDSLKCWGSDSWGQLGDDSQNLMMTSPVSVDLGAGRTAKAIGLGETHTCAILDDDSVKCWGSNYKGQLGDGTTDQRFTPVSVGLGVGRTAKAITLGQTFTCAILDDNSIKCWGSNEFGQLGNVYGLPDTYRNYADTVDLGTGLTATQIDAGESHVCAVLNDSSLKCWGKNHHGQLGQGEFGTPRGDDQYEMGNNLSPIIIH